MKTPDPRTWSGKGRDCPSELLLDRLVLEELPPPAREEVERHVQSCPDCSARIGLRRAGSRAFPELDEEALVTRIEAALAEPSGAPAEAEPGKAPKSARLPLPGPLGSILRRPRLWGPMGPRLRFAGALAGLFLAVLVGQHLWRHPGQGESDRVRAKGNVVLEVFREADGRAVQAESGDRFRAGDRIRFRVTLPGGGYLMVLGRESSGSIYPSYPSDAEASAVPFPAGGPRVLPGALTLDDSPGQESLFLLVCDHPFTPAEARLLLRQGEPPGQTGCRMTRFEILKE